MVRRPGESWFTKASVRFEPVLKQWYHIALVHLVAEGISTPWSIYINGQIGGESDTHPLDVAPMTEPLEFGRQFYFTSSTYFGGRMDEIAIFDRALSPQEILTLHNAGSLGKCLQPSARVLLPRR